MALPASAFMQSDAFLGEGIRKKKVGFIEVSVYRLGLYIDALAAFPTLTRFKGLSHQCLCQDSCFYKEFIGGRFRKTFLITFLRSIGSSQLQSGFRTPLTERIPSSEVGILERLISAVPDVEEGDFVKFQMEADGESIEFSGSAITKVVCLKSQHVWTAVQEIYFDVNTQFVDIKKGSIERLPDVLSSIECSQSSHNQSDVDKKQSAQDCHGACPNTIASSLPPSTCSSERQDEDVVVSFGVREARESGETALTSAKQNSHSSCSSRASKTLCIKSIALEKLEMPEYRLGDKTMSLFASSGATGARLASVYADVALGDTSSASQTDFRRSASYQTEPVGVSAINNPLELPTIGCNLQYKGETKLRLKIFDKRGVQSILRGDPIIGEVVLTLPPEQELSDKKPVLQGATLWRGTSMSGCATVEYQLSDSSKERKSITLGEALLSKEGYR